MVVDSLDIRNSLIGLGLNKIESSVYLALLSRDISSILELSRDTNIPRSTVYRVSKKLIDKRFAEWVVESKVQKVKAVRPDGLDFVLKEKSNDLKNVTNSLKNLQQMVSSVVTHVPKTQVRYYQGKSGMQQLIWNTLKANKEICGYSEFGRVDVVGVKFYQEYVREFNLRGLRDRAIANENGLNYIKNHVISSESKHQLDESGIKLIPKEKFYVSGDTSFYNNIYSVSYWKKGEIVGVEVENIELVKMHQSIFDILWNLAEPLSDFLC